jgi:hypothetical protein
VIEEREAPMFPPFNLFKEDSDGHTQWLGAMEDFAAAKATARELMKSSPGEYFALSQTTGNKFYIKPDEDRED